MDEALLELTLERTDALPKCERALHAAMEALDGNSAPEKKTGAMDCHGEVWGNTGNTWDHLDPS